MTAAPERLRQVLSRALGDERLAQVGEDEPLLQSGLVSSLELVTLVSALEEAYGIRIPPSQATNENLASLSAMARLVAGQPGRPPTAEVARPGYPSWRRYWRRPWLALLLVALTCAALDQLWRLSVRTALWGSYLDFREGGRRLYPGDGDLAQDDFEVAAEAHELFREPAPPGGWVLVLGDSGTIGSYLHADEAFPAQAERRLHELGRPQVRLANLAYYGRLLAKDLMLLELAWDRPLRAVVFTVGDDHLSRRLNRLWTRDYPHVSINYPLLERFRARVAPADRALFDPILAELRASDRRYLGPLRRFSERHLGLGYRGFLRYLVYDRMLPDTVATPPKVTRLAVRLQRLAYKPPQLVHEGLPPRDVDRSEVELLRVTVRLLRARGVQVVLLVEPAGPRSWRRPLAQGLVEGTPEFRRLAHETGAHLLDLRWALDADAFTDNQAHYTAAGAHLLGDALGNFLDQEVLR